LRRLFVSLFILFPFFLLAQQAPTEDSLMLQLKNSTNQAKGFNDLAQYYYANNNVAFFENAQQALKIAKQYNDKEQQVRSLIMIGDYYALVNKPVEAENAYQTGLNTGWRGIYKGQLYYRIALLNYEKAAYIKSIEYIEQARLEINLNTSSELAFQFFCLEGRIRLAIEDISGVEVSIKQAEKLLPQVTDPINKAIFYNLAGTYQFLRNDFQNAFNHLTEAIKELKGSMRHFEYGQSLLVISRIYELQKNYPLALQNAGEALSIYTQSGNKNGQVEALCLVGDIYLEQKSTTLAFENFQNALKIANQFDNAYLKSVSYQNLSKWYLEQNQFTLAQENLIKAIGFCPEEANFQLKFKIYSQQSRLYLLQNNADSALFYAQRAMGFISIPGYWNDYKSTCQLIGDILYLKGNYKNSIEFNRMAMAYTDSIWLKMNQMDLSIIESNQEAQRQKNRINLLTFENQERENTIKLNNQTIIKQKAFIITSSILLFIVLVFSILLGVLLNQKRKSNIFLEANNLQIALQKQEIEAQRAYLAEINSELEKLSLVARETDNAIRIIDAKGEVIWINESYTRLHGYTLDDLKQRNVLFFTSDSNSIDVRQMVNIWFGDKKPISFEVEVNTKWNTKIWVQTTLTPILTPDKKLSKLIAIDTDITALKNAQQEIVAMNQDITSSITYAKRIQEAMMTPFSVLTSHFPESFCFHKPKSIVSGDFYWVSYQSNRLIVACADSTGHGVPGAFMSLIGISFLNRIVSEKGFVSPAVILNRLRMNIINHLHQTDNQMAAGDGMDMAIISIDKQNNLLEFAGAMNPMYILRNGDIIELKPDRMPVGFYDNEDRPFSSTSISIKKGDQLYMFSDGFYDQFGGETGSKMKASRFKEILKKCAGKSSQEQYDILSNAFDSWKGKYNQVDDVLVIGIEIP